jgi:hypothetical protein
MQGLRLKNGPDLRLRWRHGGKAVNYPEHSEIWSHNRDSINMVVGAIIGAYLGLTISRQGLENGSLIDLFNLITFTAFSAAFMISFGNRWFFGNLRISLGFAAAALPSAFLSIRSAENLGVDTDVFSTIYVAWAYLIVLQVLAFELAKYLRKKKND